MKDAVAWPSFPEGNPKTSRKENLRATLTILRNAENPQEAIIFIHMLGLNVFDARVTLQERHHDV